MLSYHQPLFRPPSEAHSLIFQVTLGCSHNQCLFCGMYKSKIYESRPLEKVLEEIREVAHLYDSSSIHRIFLADGDALGLPTKDLIQILNEIKLRFSKIHRISSYASALNLLKKSEEELKEIHNAGLKLLYLGLESGDDETLNKMLKGSSAGENVEAVLNARRCGFKTSVMMILGLAGITRSKEHAILSGQAVSKMNPDFLSALTLMVPEQAPIYRQLKQGSFKPLTANEILNELKIFIEHVNGKNIIFRSTHASNYLALKGVLSRDKDELIKQIEQSIKTKNLRPEYLRGL